MILTNCFLVFIGWGPFEKIIDLYTRYKWLPPNLWGWGTSKQTFSFSCFRKYLRRWSDWLPSYHSKINAPRRGAKIGSIWFFKSSNL